MTFYFDEDSSDHRLVAALRSRGIDVTTFLDARMNRRDDEAHLVHASAEGRVLVTANAGDFARLHRDWLAQGRTHRGILVIPQQRFAVGELVRRVLRVATSNLDPVGTIYYLSSF